MGIREELNNSVQRITLSVKIGGVEIANVAGVDVSMGLSQVNAAAQITIAGARPSVAEEYATVDIWAGYNGSVAQIFYGELSGVDWEHFPGTIKIDARDRLARLRLPWGGEDREYTEQEDGAIIQNLVEAMGISSEVTHIESSGWEMGVIEPVVARADQSFWPLVEEIDRLTGYRTYTTSDGVIRRTRVSGQVGGGGAFTYEKGVNIIRGRRTRSLNGIVNKITIRGLTYEGLEVIGEATADSPYIPDPPGTVGESIQSNLVETDADAQSIAQRMVSDRNRRPEAFEGEVIGNPLLQPGMTVTVIHDELESGSANLLLDRVQHTISRNGFRTSIRTMGGALSGVSQAAPIPAFDLKLFLEGEDTGSGVTTKIVGVADGTASIDQDGDASLMTFAWEVAATGGTPNPASGSGPVFRFVVDGDATEITVTLTVTDVQSMTGVLTRTVAIDQSNMLIEELWTAEGSVVAGTFDGEKTWIELSPASGNATCLAPFAAEWGQIWGTSTGHIYATFDRLESLTDLGAPAGAIACTAVWIHEQDSTRLWAGFNDGKVYQGTLNVTAKTATWALRGTVPAGPVREIRESYGTLGELRAMAGANYYYSTTAGATWTLVDSGDTASRMAAGFDLNLYSFLNDAEPLRAEGGTTITLPADTEHIRGVSFGWRIEEIYAADNEANLLRSAEGNLTTLEVVGSAPAGVNHLVRSGNLDGVVYGAVGDGTGGNSGAIKSIRNEDPWYIRRTDDRQVYMVGVGVAHLPNVIGDIELIRLSNGDVTPSGSRGVWHFVKNIGWTQKNSGLPSSGDAAIFWLYIAANPFNPNQWLLVGNTVFEGDYRIVGDQVLMKDLDVSPLWYTGNAGTSWSPVVLPKPNYSNLHLDVPPGSKINRLWMADWSTTTAGRWWAPAYCANAGDGEGGVLFTGTLGSGDADAYVSGTSGTFDVEVYQFGAAGLQDQVLISADQENGVLNAAATNFTPASRRPGDPAPTLPTNQSFFMERMPDASPTIVATRSLESPIGRGVQIISNYRSALNLLWQPDTMDTVPGWSVTATREGVYLAGGRNGVLRYPATRGTGDIYSIGVAAAVEAIGALPTLWVRADRQTRSLVAATLQNQIGCWVYNGSAWAYQPGPAAFADNDGSKLAGFIEVINRESI